MGFKDIIIALTIHLVIPIIGVVLFLKQMIKMAKDEDHPSFLEYFIIYATYGGLLIVF